MRYFEIKNTAHKKYQNIGSISCPYFHDKVKFNSNGFWHIVYASRGKKRDIRIQQLRFQLLDKAVALLKITTTLQEFEARKRKLIVNKNHQKTTKPLLVKYFGFIAIIDGWKIKVIVKKIGNGGLFFWSIIPNWKTRLKETILSKGDLEQD